MLPPVTADEALASIRSRCVQIAEGDPDLWEVGSEIWATAMTHVGVDDSGVLYGLYLIWASLTDWIETPPTTAGQAEWRSRAGGADQAMRDAARGWLDVEASPRRTTEYIDYWLYDVIGLERPMAPGSRPQATD
jgi:hypothetical protein